MDGGRGWTDPNDERDPAGSRAARGSRPRRLHAAARVPPATALRAGLAPGESRPSPDTLVAEATPAAPLPCPRNLPIDTFVVLMMENRSFDHYLGWLPDADGIQGGLTYADRQERSTPRAGSTTTSRAAPTRIPTTRGRAGAPDRPGPDGRLPALG